MELANTVIRVQYFPLSGELLLWGMELSVVGRVGLSVVLMI